MRIKTATLLETVNKKIEDHTARATAAQVKELEVYKTRLAQWRENKAAELVNELRALASKVGGTQQWSR